MYLNVISSLQLQWDLCDCFTVVNMILGMFINRYRVHQVQQDVSGIAGYGGDEWALYAWTD